MHRVKGQIGICATAVATALIFSMLSAFAQPWPQRPVRMIVPIAPGSSPDVAARVFGEQLGGRLGKAVIVENRPGADGLIGTAAFAAAQDDHVLLFSFAAPLSVYPVIQEKLSYDPIRDVLPVSVAVETFGTISVPASLPVTTLRELVAFARARPGQLNWSTGGGAFPILMAGFIKAAGVEMAHVPYANQNLAIQDLAEGRIQVFATPMTAVMPLAQAGKLRVLAVTNKTRSPVWQAIPTVKEAGYPELAFEGLIGVFAPRDTPGDRRERLAAEIRTIAVDPAVVSRLGATGQIVRGNTPAEFAAEIDDQRSRIAAIVKLVGRPKQ